jgi:hypothetical protein
MHSFLDSKLMAKALRQALLQRQMELSHSECLELVAKQFGLTNWNTLSALIDAASGRNAPLVLPRDWVITRQTDQKYYRLGLDPDAPGTALVECKFDRTSNILLMEDHYATVMQSVVADEFRGQRLKLTASISTVDADRGTIWMRVDGVRGNVLGFDNLRRRQTDGALTGTAGWTERHIVLDVPDEAESIQYGFLLQGYGRISARSFRLETVDQAIAPTNGRGGRLLPRPTNIDFSDSSRPDA